MNSGAVPEDAYLRHFLCALALETALKTGLIDQLTANGPITISSLGMAPRPARILAAILVEGGICAWHDGFREERAVILAPAFSEDDVGYWSRNSAFCCLPRETCLRAFRIF